MKVDAWIAEGFNIPLRTPDNTLIFVTREAAREIKAYLTDCVGCLSTCKLRVPSKNIQLAKGQIRVFTAFGKGWWRLFRAVT